MLRAVVDTPLGKLEVYNLHLSHKSDRNELREAQIRDVIRYVEESYSHKHLPAVVAGDFNSPPASEVYRLVMEANFVDAAVTAEEPSEHGTSGIGDLEDPDTHPNRRIDYIFLYPSDSSEATETIRILECKPFLISPKRVAVEESPTRWLWVSDHVGLLCKLSRDGDAPGP